MPESEPKPKLIELVAPGAGAGWKVVLKNGKPAVVHEIPIPPAEAAAAIPRLQRLAEHRHPALSPVLAWGTDPNGVWVAVEPNEGTPLSTLLSRGPLTPPAAAALGAAVLSGVAALHEAGIAMGGFAATAIRITGNGDVRLAGHPASAVRGAPSQSDLRADVRSCGMAVCAAFGVDPAGAPAPPNVPPGLVVTMRSMASGAMGPAADRAQGALREMAAALLAPDRMAAAQSELAVRAGGRETPDIATFLPKETPAAPPPPAPPAPYVPAVPRDETPVRAPVSYDAPARSMETYPAIPAPTYTAAPAPAAPAPAPAAPASAVPTWSEAPPRTPTQEPAPPAPAVAPPVAPPPAVPPPIVPPPAPASLTPPTPSPYATRPPVTPQETTQGPAVARSPFDTAMPAASGGTNPPAPMPPAAPTPAPVAPAPMPPVPVPLPPTLAPKVPMPANPEPAAPAQSTWTPVETPAWTPGKVEAPTDPGWSPAAADAAAAAAAAAAARPATNPPAPAYVAPLPSPIRAPAPMPARTSSVARRSIAGGPTERPSWLIPAIIAVVLLLLLGTVGAVVMANRGKTTTPGVVAKASPSAKTSPKVSPVASPTNKGPLAVPSFGPATAAPITKVLFCSTTTPCDIPGSPAETATACDLTSCRVEVGMYFSAAQKVPISYILKFFDRCTGTTTDLPGPNAFTPPGAGYTIAIPVDKWPVKIPAGVKSGALVAVEQQPSVAASAPLLLGSDTSCA